MDVVHKFPLIPLQINRILTRRKKILHVGFQGIELMVWILVNTESPEIELEFYPAATGEPLREDIFGFSHIGSAVSPTLVWHVFHLVPTHH